MKPIFKAVLFFIIAVCLIYPLYLYRQTFPYVSNSHSNWGEFGSFLSGTLGSAFSLFAFLGLLVSIKNTDKQFIRQSQENSFFTLLGLHTSKVQNITIDGKNGHDAFQYLNRQTKQVYIFGSVAYVRDKLAKSEIINFQDSIIDYLIKRKKLESDELSNREILSAYIENTENAEEELRGLLNEAMSPVNYDTSFSDACIIFLENETSSQRIGFLGEVFDRTYDKYGYLIDHYFKNIYYTLKYIDSSDNLLHFANVFKAQLSRYEITMLYYYLASSFCDQDLKALVKKYGLLSDIYEPDLCYSMKLTLLKQDIEYLLKNQKLTNQSSRLPSAAAD